MCVWQSLHGSPFQSSMGHLRGQPCSRDTVYFVAGSGHYGGQELCQAMTWIRYGTEVYSQALIEQKWLKAQAYTGATYRTHAFWKCTFLLREGRDTGAELCGLRP